RRRHTRFSRDWSSDVCSSDLEAKRKVQEELEEALSSVTLPEPIVKRIRERFKDAETIEGIAEAIKEEQDYLRELSGSGIVTGLGESEKEEGEGGGIDLSESFKAFGLSDDAAKVAARSEERRVGKEGRSRGEPGVSEGQKRYTR